MNRSTMALGAFLLMLGIGLLAGAPTFASLSAVGSPFSAQNAAGEGIVMMFFGIFVAALGAALLAFGIGSHENPSGSV